VPSPASTSSAATTVNSAKPLLVCGTGNRKKAGELVELLTPLGIEVKTLADFPQAIEVEESGTTFAENAALKATLQAKQLGHWVLADDSGLIVDALKGAPGVYSARYAGPAATDADNRQKLLVELQNVPLERRTARFACHLVLAKPNGEIAAECLGRCEGRIRTVESGSQGFGYDPLFEIVEYHRTFGELSSAVKQVLSHRARAMQQIVPMIAKLISSGVWSARD